VVVDAEGETLDAGGFVVGSSSRPVVRAHILGNRRPRSSARRSPGLNDDLGERLPRSAFAMVGDDLRADVAAAQRVGMKGILVLSGKTGAAEAEPGATRVPRPDGIGRHAGRRRGRARLTATFPTPLT
jgi:hypothetical protein